MTAARPVATDRMPRMTLIQGAGQGRPRPVIWIVFSLMAVAVFLGLVGARTSLDRTAFELAEVESAISEEVLRFEVLKLEVARLSAPSRIAPLAESMGMVLPEYVERVHAPGIVRYESDREERWAEIKSILAANP